VAILDAKNVQTRIRLAGIDAPEKSQPFGNRSKQHLSGLVFGKTVEVEATKKDRYERTIGKVIIAGRDANLNQLKAGMAWHYKKYESEQSATDRTAYSQAEEAARIARAGLWRDPTPIPPWDFRHGSGMLHQRNVLKLVNFVRVEAQQPVLGLKVAITA
jgi:endonuclease YncB( thermonuclease family)